MQSLLSDGLFLPALVLAIIGFATPRLWARVLPEGVASLMVNALLSTLALFLLSAVFFVCLYIWQGVPMAQILEPGIAANVLFFGQLGLIAGIIWGPIMLLSVAGLPRKWVKETW